MKKFITFIIVLIIIIVAIVAMKGLFKSGSMSAIIPNQAPKTGASEQKTITNKPSTSTDTKPASETPKTDTTTVQASKSLTAKPWQWVATMKSNGAQIVPNNPARFSLTLKADGTFSSTTDCNGVGGKYAIKDDTITFSEMMSTMMFCTNGSQEGDYRMIFDQARTFKILSDGQLRIDLKFGAGFAVFK
jgi:heat shock protein HslJ